MSQQGEVRRVRARAPGRVNLIGEHTDYNDGFVLPMALPFATVIEATPRRDGVVSLHSEGFPSVQFTLADDPKEVGSWGRFVSGMIRFMAEDGIGTTGIDASISTNIPIGASLSSSAALEVATGFAVAGLADVEPDPVRIAQLGQRVENEVIGLQSGIMDQLISAIAVDGSVTRIDCRSLAAEAVQLPAEAKVVIMDTMTRRELADSEYDLRRAACNRASEAIGVAALRDANLEQVESLLSGVDQKRARHVVTENRRVAGVVAALRNGDLAAVGELMSASHRSLDSDYAVSSDALNSMVAIAREHESCLGARMTGGGFAGSAVALVDAAGASMFIKHVAKRWTNEFGERPNVWDVRPSAGASVEVVA